MMFALQCLGIFALTAVLDVFWALYVKATAGKKALRAATISAGLYVMAGTATISYVGNHWFLIPCMTGAFVGTFIGTKWEPLKEPEPK